ncbi:hypothetical protein AAFH68_13400 [Flavobacterium sp. CGRL1]
MKKKADNQKTDEIDKTELLNKVRLSINEKCQDWVLFQNGTYIIFDHAETIPDIENEAIKLMKEFGPVYVQTPSEDFDVTDLKKDRRLDCFRTLLRNVYLCKPKRKKLENSRYDSNRFAWTQ